MKQQSERSNSPNINDAFDEILFTEERIIEESFEEGFSAGQSQGNPEAYHLGYHRGAALGAELGYYLGIVTAQSQQSHPPKIATILDALKCDINDFPTENLDVNLQEKVDRIRLAYRRLCTLLRIEVGFPEDDKLTF